MLTLNRRNLWVRWASCFSSQVHRGRTVSLCKLVWAGILPPVMVLGFVAFAVKFWQGLRANANVKEFALFSAVLLVGFGFVVWADNRKRNGKDLSPRLLREAAWGIKNRVCPVVRLED